MGRQQRYEAVTSTGEHIGTYSAADAVALFGSAATIKNGKLIVDSHRLGPMDAQHGWRQIEEYDKSKSWWNAEAFEQSFDMVFALNISSMRDVRRLKREQQRQLNRKPRQIKRKPDIPTDEPSDEGLAFDKAKPIPSALDMRWIMKSDKIYCVDKSGRRVSPAELEAAIIQYKLNSRAGSANSQKDQHRSPSKHRNAAAAKDATTYESSSHAELLRRNAEITQKAMLEHRNDHLKPAGWEATQKFNEEKAKRKEQEQRKREREAAEKKRKRAAEKKKKKEEAAKKQQQSEAAAKRQKQSEATARKSASASRLRTNRPAPSMTDKACLIAELEKIQAPVIAEGVKNIFYAQGMEGIVMRAMMLLRSSNPKDKPASFDLYATENTVRYRYCKMDSIRMYCLKTVAEAIERKVSEDTTEGPQPYIWALDNAKSKLAAIRRAAMSILNDREHLILFSGAVLPKASSCTEELTILPFETTLVRIDGIPGTWGAVAYMTSRGPKIETIGEIDCQKKASSLLAYIEHHCSMLFYDDSTVDFEARGSNTTQEKSGSRQPRRAAVASTKNDIRTHVIQSESDRMGAPNQTTTGAHRAPESIRPHVRRAHLRRQRYGKGNSLVKVIAIKETQVNPRSDGVIPFDQRVHVVM